MVENIPRVLPGDAQATIERGTWPRPAIFDWLQQAGNVSDAEMHRVFNCGIGMVVIVAPEHADAAQRMLTASGESVHRIGAITPRAAGARGAVVV